MSNDKPTPPVPDEPGPEMQALAEKAPKVMGELMEQFISRKTLTQRATIRLRMKALLDLFSADTGYPPIPSISAGAPRPMGAYQPGAYVGGAFGAQGAPVHPMPPMGVRAQGEIEAVQRAVEEAIGEERGAQEEADVVPAPGAPAAQPG